MASQKPATKAPFKGNKNNHTALGGSKYSKKNHGKSRKTVPKLKRGEPVFTYYVQGTDVQATKVPCERTAEDRAERRWSKSPLGTWRDSRNGKKCKVDRVRNKPEVVSGDLQEAA